MSFHDFVAKHQARSYVTVYNRKRSQSGTVVCSEKGKKYCYKYGQGETFLKIRVDGGMIQDPNKSKCDYLVLNTTELNSDKKENSNFHSIFVELKGTDIRKACEQLLATIKECARELTESKLHARIVVSKAHAPKISALQHYQKEFHNLKCSFACQSQTMTEYTGADGTLARK